MESKEDADQSCWRGLRKCCHIGGEFKVGRDFFEAHPGRAWLPLRGLDAALRGISQVIFVNNPLSGLIILAGLFLADPLTGLAAIASSLLAVLTAAYFGQPVDQVSNGLTQFNAVLVGTVMITLWPVVAQGELTVRVWILVMLGSCLSVVVGKACNGFLAGVQATFLTGYTLEGSEVRAELGIPGFTLPFNLVAWVLWSLLQEVEDIPDKEGEAEVIMEEIDWGNLFLGSLYGMGQVYGVYSLPCSILIFIGCALFSPLLALCQWLGSIIGCFTALGVSASPLSSTYIGLWSFCPLLTAGACSYFSLPTLSSIPFFLLSVTSTVLVQAALLPLFGAIGLPHFTIPFVLTSWVFLLFSTGNTIVIRPQQLSTPEEHLITLWKRQDSVMKKILKRAKSKVDTNNIDKSQNYVIDTPDIPSSPSKYIDNHGQNTVNQGSPKKTFNSNNMRPPNTEIERTLVFNDDIENRENIRIMQDIMSDINRNGHVS